MLKLQIISKAYMDTDSVSPFLFRVEYGFSFQHASYDGSAEGIIPVWLNTTGGEIERALSAATDNTGAVWRRSQRNMLIVASGRLVILGINGGSL